ncbi:MAG: DUF4230 domain-containing protein [Eubacterium sp.]|nr:DUF4230 domain-containing protein [Eubacterium sp.]
MEDFDIAKIKKYGIIAAIILVAALGLVALGVFVIAPKLQPKGGTVSTITESKLERILEISQLNTVEYTYNAVATIYNEDYTYIKYYVAYDGTVKAGIDFSKVDVSVDETTKTIFINLPDVEIMDVLVDAGSMEYIFPDEFMESETITEEAYRLCNENLRMKAENEEKMYTMARKNAETAVSGLIKPWVKQVDEGYQIKIVWKNAASVTDASDRNGGDDSGE